MYKIFLLILIGLISCDKPKLEEKIYNDFDTFSMLPKISIGKSCNIKVRCFYVDGNMSRLKYFNENDSLVMEDTILYSNRVKYYLHREIKSYELDKNKNKLFCLRYLSGNFVREIVLNQSNDYFILYKIKDIMQDGNIILPNYDSYKIKKKYKSVEDFIQDIKKIKFTKGIKEMSYRYNYVDDCKVNFLPILKIVSKQSTEFYPNSVGSMYNSFGSCLYLDALRIK